MVTAVENTFFNLSLSPLPISKVISRLIATLKEPVNTENKATTPPTTLYIPKLSTPKDCKLIRLVKSPINIKNSIRKYNSSVFFAIRLLLFEDCVCDIIYLNFGLLTLSHAIISLAEIFF